MVHMQKDLADYMDDSTFEAMWGTGLAEVVAAFRREKQCRFEHPKMLRTRKAGRHIDLH